jgi:hypothetical protein
MSENRSVSKLIQEHKTLLLIIMIGLFLLELEIFALAVMKSGRKSWLQALDHKGNVIYETDGRQLSDFNKYYFEKTFGPFKNYNVRLQTKEIPFPFRAWFTAAVGLPLGLILLFGFIVKAYLTLFHGDRLKKDDPAPEKQYGNKVARVLYRISRLNIFIIGFLILIGVLAYWVLPNFIVYVGQTGIETIIRFKWVFISVFGIVLGLFLWIIYLRYLLAKKSIETQAELDKFKLQLNYQKDESIPSQLKASSNKPVQIALPRLSKGNKT